MSSTVTILQDLSVIAAVSGVFALLFNYLKMPLLLGYMVGGFVIGPHFFSNWVLGATSIEQLSELGVIFLMFYIGLEFDLMKLKKIFAPSAFWLTFQTIGMMAIGMMIAPLLGWSGLNGLFLGSMLVMSSTMITVPLLKAKNALNTEYAQCAVGCLILEDILAIVFLVILSSIARTGQFDLSVIKKSAFVIGVFVVMVFCFGKLFAPFFVRALFKSSSAEVLAVSVVGFMMAICLLAHYFHFSVALGAFLAGSILSQTHIAEQVDKLTEPLRDVFNAVFFTTIGMMIDLKAIMHLWPWILVLAIITFAGQTFIGTFALFLFGKRPETAFKAAFSKAQIGEFSFVIATLGNSLGVLHKDFISVTVGVALGTILICSMFSKRTDDVYKFFSSKFPSFLKEFGDVYHNLLGEIKESVSKSGFIKLTINQLMSAILWFFLLSGTIYIVCWLAALTQSGQFDKVLSQTIHFLGEIFLSNNNAWKQMGENKAFEISSNVLQLVIWATAFLICIPFLIGIVKSIQNIFINLIKHSLTTKSQNELLNNRAFGVMKAISVIAALFLFSGIFLGIAARFIPSGIPIILFGTIAIVLTIFLWKQLSSLNNRLEIAFIESFNDKIESQEQINRKSILARAAKTNPWPVMIHEFTLKAQHDAIGRQLSDLKLRELTGTTIIAITRGGLSTYKFGPDLQFFPGDHIIVMGTQEQINNAKLIILKEAENTQIKKEISQFDIFSFCIGADKNFSGKSLAELNLRQKYGLNVVGIQRNSEKIIDIKSNIELRENDILLLAGTQLAIDKFKNGTAAV